MIGIPRFCIYAWHETLFECVLLSWVVKCNVSVLLYSCISC